MLSKKATQSPTLREHYGRYDIVYVDPPWPYYGDPNKNAAAGKHYNLMSIEDLAALRVRDLFRDTKYGALFMWATCPRLDLAIDLGRSWNLNYRGVAFNWVKCRSDGRPIGAQGIPPTGTKPTTELCLLWTTCKTGRPFPLLNAGIAQYVEEELVYAARGAHSEKPGVVRNRIVELYGDRPRIELFARQAVCGWACWGDQAPC